MVVMLACAALVAIGIVLVVRWGGGAPAPQPLLAGLPRALAAGAAAGVLAAGAGGRLIMRLLAVSSPEAQGGITEAGERIGDITAGGTLGFFLFVGVPAGGLSVLLFVLAGALLPRGRLGGVALGLVLLLLAGPRIEPLRADNFDFSLVGPDWLSLVSFTALAVFQGMLTWALATRLDVPVLPLRHTAARVVAAVVVLAALPGFVGAVADIA